MKKIYSLLWKTGFAVLLATCVVRRSAVCFAGRNFADDCDPS